MCTFFSLMLATSAAVFVRVTCSSAISGQLTAVDASHPSLPPSRFELAAAALLGLFLVWNLS